MERQHEWHNARFRFFKAFAKRGYDIDRLIGAANMFDVLPDSAAPASVPLGDELKLAQTSARDLFERIEPCPERDSILSALGRIGTSTLKRKVRHRAQRLIDSAGQSFPDLIKVTDEAVNCRNYYVHGGTPRFDYDRNFSAVLFFTDTLEFVFAASDLIQAGWDIPSWIRHGTSMTHPFGGYWANYATALQRLKDLLPRAFSPQ